MYGVIACTVQEQARSIAIRMALGATRGLVLRGMVLSAVTLGGVGLLAGLVAALNLGKVLSGLVYGVSPRDPMALACAALVLLACAALGGLVPALRAAAVDPVAILRSE